MSTGVVRKSGVGAPRQRGRIAVRLVLPALCAWFAIGVPARGGDTASRPQEASRGERRWAILVAGISGDPDLQKEYLQELVDLRNALESRLGFPKENVIALFDKPELDPERVQYESNRENLARACKEVAARAAADDLVFVFIEGHGAFDGTTYKLNLVGPDLSSQDLAGMLYSIPAARFIVVNATNCSGASLPALAGKGKIVIAATRSGSERNLTHLGRYFIEAFADNNADVDKNARVSIFEAFTYAGRRLEEFHTKEGSLQSEHPVLNDDGSERALTSAELGERSAFLSRGAYLDRGSPFVFEAGAGPEAQALAKEAQDLEKQIELLKSAKDEMTEVEYDKRLEALLLKLAVVQAKLRRK